MTIAVSIGKKPYSSVLQTTLGKFALASEIVKWMQAYFEAKRVEVWVNASDETLGGRMERNYTLEDRRDVPVILDKVANENKEKLGVLENLVVVVKGVWQTGDYALPAYVGISNGKLWRETYGDIEVNVFPSGEIEDISQLIWHDEDVRTGVVTNFLKEFGRFGDESLDMESIVYAYGIPTQVSVGDWLASYFRRPDLYFVRFLRSLEQDNPTIGTYIRMINRLALTGDLYDIPNFRKHIQEVGGRNKVKVDFGASLKLVGETPEAYKSLYRELSVSLAEIIEKSLPKDRQIDENLRAVSAKLAGFATFEKSPDDKDSPRR
jgi:hypothetical protein